MSMLTVIASEAGGLVAKLFVTPRGPSASLGMTGSLMTDRLGRVLRTLPRSRIENAFA